jgi:hypothetical protein
MNLRFAVGACALALGLASNAAAAPDDPADASLALRRECETLTAQGRRDEAVLACSNALQTVRSGANVRALVSALVDGPTPPTSSELAIALTVTAQEHDRGGGPTAAAAACDIAERIGDMIMLQQCADELRRTAPDDPATRRAVSVLAAQCPPWRFWGGWALIAAAVAGALVHAGRRAARRWARRASVPAAAAVTMVLLARPGAARADAPAVPEHGWLNNKWHIDDEHPEANIPSETERNADPLQFGYWLQDLAWKAEHASRTGDHAAAVKYYSALAVAVPDRAIGFVKTCEEYEALGDGDKAIEMCGQALLRDGLTVHDYDHFIHLVLAQPRPLRDKETASLAEVLLHMREDPAGRDFVDDLECQVGTRTSNVAQLEECTAALQARAPDDPKTISYLWALAVAKGNTGEAAKLVDRAKAAGVAPQDIERMSRATEDRTLQRTVHVLLWAAAIGLLAAGMAVAARAIVARRRLAAG